MASLERMRDYTSSHAVKSIVDKNYVDMGSKDINYEKPKDPVVGESYYDLDTDKYLVYVGDRWVTLNPDEEEKQRLLREQKNDNLLGDTDKI